MPPARPRIGDPSPPEVSLRDALAGLGGLSLGLALAGVAVGALLLG